MTAANRVPVVVIGAVGRESAVRMFESVATASPGARWRQTVLLLSPGSELVAPGGHARSWSEVLSSLESDAVVVVATPDRRVRDTARLSGAAVVTSGLDAGADVRGSELHAHSSGTSLRFVADGSEHQLNLQLLGEQSAEIALAVIAAAIANGVDVETAATSLERLDSVGAGLMRPYRAPDGPLVIDDTASMAAESVTASLKALAMYGMEGRRTVALLGALDLPHLEDGILAHTVEHREAHDRIGRIIVRLNIAKLVVVGDDARHIHNAAGLEGSWNGESTLVDSLAEAYDRVREDLGREDVVLVKCRDAQGTVEAFAATLQGGIR